MRILVLALLAPVFIGCQASDSGLNTDPTVGAPTGTIEARDAWGHKKLGGIYGNTVKWLKQAPVVSQEVGKIKLIAPIGTPNYQNSGYSNEFRSGGFRREITLEIIGEKNKAIFSGRGYMTNELAYNDPNGTLKIGSKEIKIHSSGLSMDEFNKPKIKISIIKDYINRYYSPEFIWKAEDDLQKLSETYAEIEDYQNAIKYLKLAKSGFLKDNENAVNSPGSEREFIGLNQHSAEGLRGYLRQEALYYYYLGNLDQVSTSLSQVLKTPFLVGKLRTDNLWLWVIQSRSNKQALANQELRKSIKLAIKNQDMCWLPFAKFSVGDLPEEDFISHFYGKDGIMNPDCGDRSEQPGIALAYYYSAQKQFIDGKYDQARDTLYKFLATNEWNNRKFEKLIAIYDVKYDFKFKKYQ